MGYPKKHRGRRKIGSKKEEQEKEIKKIILTRPAVEAGENLGYLPGDLKEKLDPLRCNLYMMH